MHLHTTYELLTARDRIGEPCAVAGLTLALHRGWLDVEPPPLPQFVVPASRHPALPGVAAVRRIKRWDDLSIVRDADGLPALGPADAVASLAEYCDDGDLHVVLQRLVFERVVGVEELVRRRRTGRPGSARLGRVCDRYLLGLDSPQEVVVFRELRRRGFGPDHLNVLVRTSDGVVAGPFDGYSEVGAAYQVEGAVHFDGVRAVADARRDARSLAAGVEVVKLLAPDVAARMPMLDGWHAALAAAAARGAGEMLTVVHLAGRGCPCGQQPPLASTAA